MRKRGACSPLFLLSGVGVVRELGGKMGADREGGGLFCLCATKEAEGRLSMKGE